MNEAIEEVRQSFEDLADKVGCFAHSALEAAMDRMDVLYVRETTLNQQIYDLRKQLGDLTINMNLLEPVQIIERLDLLRRAIFSCNKPSTHRLREELHKLEIDWNHLHFLYTFPDTEELNPDSFQSNLFHRLKNRDREALRSLQEQCLAAEEVFNGKGFTTYWKLSQTIHRDVEGRLFERFPEVPLEQISHEVLAAAIMASLGDRMMAVTL